MVFGLSTKVRLHRRGARRHGMRAGKLTRTFLTANFKSDVIHPRATLATPDYGHSLLSDSFRRACGAASREQDSREQGATELASRPRCLCSRGKTWPHDS